MNSPMSCGTDWAGELAIFFGGAEDDAGKGACRFTGAELDWANKAVDGRGCNWGGDRVVGG